jgi:hypothetical protein
LNPGGGEIFRTCPDGPWVPPSLLYNGYRVFPGGKMRPGRDANLSPTSSAVGHERVELYLYSPMGRTACTEPQCLYKSALYYFEILTLSDPTSYLVRHYGFPVPLRCRKTSETVFVAFVSPLSEPVRRLSSCSKDFSQQIAQVVLFLFLYVFLF